ncbi:uncharacterized protein LOC143861008 [Tasmannia lanceolata]|uniref:uncharacterized protein LOC143861008 n=1 Tax=Tasmannia lanceolata TaxID=3420 RepID=UPI0040644E90
MKEDVESFLRCGFFVVSVMSCIGCEVILGFVWVALVGLIWGWKVLKGSLRDMVRVKKERFSGGKGGEKMVDFLTHWRRTEISLPESKRSLMVQSSFNISKCWSKSLWFWLSESQPRASARRDSGEGAMNSGNRDFVFRPTSVESAVGKILLVEDTEINRMLLRKLFRDLNLLFEEAENGQIAVDFFKQGKSYDLVLMDKEMPVMDGHEATRQLRLLGVKTPIVALTGNSLQSDKDMFFQAGANEFRTKPLSREELVRLLARYGLEHPPPC